MSRNQSQSAITMAGELRKALDACRPHFLFAGVYSVIVNLLFLAYPVYMMQVFDRVTASRSVDTLIVLFIAFCLIMISKAVFTWLQNLLLGRAAARVERLMGDRVCTAMITRAASQHRDTGVQAINDLDTARGYLCGPSMMSRFDLPWAGLFVGILVAIDPIIGLTAVACLVVIIALTLLNSAVSRHALDDANAEASRSQQFLEANLRSSEAIVPMGMLPGLLARWQKSRQLVIGAQLAAGKKTTLMSAILASGQILAQGIVLSAGVFRAIEANIPAGLAFMSILIFGAASKPVMTVVSSWEARLRARKAVDRLTLLLQEIPKSEGKAMALPKPEGEVTLSSVNYFVRGGTKPLLRGVNLKFAAGGTHGIMGPSGSGKTTIIRLIAGNLHATMGHVRVDGADVRNWDRNMLGRYMGYLPQEVCLVSGTVADNIGRFGLFDEEAVVAAARMAGAHDIILRLPLGYDTPVGEGGMQISGGQRQMIGLARAVVGDPSIVILDEPNSNLDGPGEARLMACIAALKEKGCTVLMVSHRPNLLREFDTLTHVRDGSIAAHGPALQIMQRMRPESQFAVVSRKPTGDGAAQETV